MTQEQIKESLQNWSSLSGEEKENLKSSILDTLAKTDNLGEISDDVATKLNGGGGIDPKKVWEIILGYILPPTNP